MFEWQRDDKGWTLWSGGTYLGCVYSRGPHGPHQHEYRALNADFREVFTTVPGSFDEDPQETAKRALVSAFTGTSIE